MGRSILDQLALRQRGIMGAFDRGQVPTIACINKATISLGHKPEKLVAALQAFLDHHFVPVWGTPAEMALASEFVKGAWAILFLDDADVEGALGYHDLTPDGLPLSKVFVKTTVDSGQKVSVTACHELAEMLIDPAINLCCEGANQRIYAYEVCDPCEEIEFNVNRIAMSDFVYPSWFEGFRKAKSTQFDHCKKITRPWQILPGGYMPVFENGEWGQIFGSGQKARRFKQEDRRGHRSELRASQSELGALCASGKA